MDYKHIDGFFEKIKKLLSNGETLNIIISEMISKHIGFEVTKEKIKTKGNIIYIQSSPMLRGEILMHKSSILNEINNNVSGRTFIDIK